MASIKSKIEIVNTITMSSFYISNTLNDMLNSIEEQGGKYVDLKVVSMGEHNLMIIILYTIPSKKASDTDEVDLSLLF